MLVSGGKQPDGGKQLWGSGFLPSVYQGVQCRSHGEPVLYLQNPPGVTRSMRRSELDAIDEINQQQYNEFGDPETITRISQYEMAFRMQMDATDALDIHKESAATLAEYGCKPGEESFANNCLVARRLAERGVRFIQLYHWGWDTHGVTAKDALNIGFADRCRETDQPVGALLTDLKQRGMLEDTLVVWGGEFGRTSMRENRDGKVMQFVGRDHNPGAFTIWMTGGGIKGGMSHGKPMRWATRSQKIRSRFATCMPPCSTLSASIIASSIIRSRDSIKNSPASSPRGSLPRFSRDRSRDG